MNNQATDIFNYLSRIDHARIGPEHLRRLEKLQERVAAQNKNALNGMLEGWRQRLTTLRRENEGRKTPWRKINIADLWGDSHLEPAEIGLRIIELTEVLSQIQPDIKKDTDPELDDLIKKARGRGESGFADLLEKHRPTPSDIYSLGTCVSIVETAKSAAEIELSRQSPRSNRPHTEKEEEMTAWIEELRDFLTRVEEHDLSWLLEFPLLGYWPGVSFAADELKLFRGGPADELIGCWLTSMREKGDDFHPDALWDCKPSHWTDDMVWAAAEGLFEEVRRKRVDDTVKVRTIWLEGWLLFKCWRLELYAMPGFRAAEKARGAWTDFESAKRELAVFLEHSSEIDELIRWWQSDLEKLADKYENNGGYPWELHKQKKTKPADWDDTKVLQVATALLQLVREERQENAGGKPKWLEWWLVSNFGPAAYAWPGFEAAEKELREQSSSNINMLIDMNALIGCWRAHVRTIKEARDAAEQARREQHRETEEGDYKYQEQPDYPRDLHKKKPAGWDDAKVLQIVNVSLPLVRQDREKNAGQPKWLESCLVGNFGLATSVWSGFEAAELELSRIGTLIDILVVDINTLIDCWREHLQNIVTKTTAAEKAAQAEEEKSRKKDGEEEKKYKYQKQPDYPRNLFKERPRGWDDSKVLQVAKMLLQLVRADRVNNGHETIWLEWSLSSNFGPSCRDLIWDVWYRYKFPVIAKILEGRMMRGDMWDDASVPNFAEDVLASAWISIERQFRKWPQKGLAEIVKFGVTVSERRAIELIRRWQRSHEAEGKFSQKQPVETTIPCRAMIMRLNILWQALKEKKSAVVLPRIEILLAALGASPIQPTPPVPRTLFDRTDPTGGNVSWDDCLDLLVEAGLLDSTKLEDCWKLFRNDLMKVPPNIYSNTVILPAVRGPTSKRYKFRTLWFDFPDWLKVHQCVELALVKRQVNRLRAKIGSKNHRVEALISWLEQVPEDYEWCDQEIPEVVACKLEFRDLDLLKGLDSTTKLYWPVGTALEYLDRLDGLTIGKGKRRVHWKDLSFSRMNFSHKSLEVMRLILSEGRQRAGWIRFNATFINILSFVGRDTAIEWNQLHEWKEEVLGIMSNTLRRVGPGVRRAVAAEVLGRIGDPVAEAILRSMGERCARLRERVAKALARILGEIRNPADVTAFQTALLGHVGPGRTKAARALIGQIVDPAATVDIEVALKVDADLRRAVANALGAVFVGGGRSAVPHVQAALTLYRASERVADVETSVKNSRDRIRSGPPRDDRQRKLESDAASSQRTALEKFLKKHLAPIPRVIEHGIIRAEKQVTP